MAEVVIAAGVRTPIGTFGGAFKEMPAWQLGAIVIEEALRRARVTPDQVDEVILGNVLQAGQGMNPARQAALAAGLPDRAPAMTINAVCGSGLKAIDLAYQAIALGTADIVVAGGMENMSRAPFLLPRARFGYRMGDGTLVDSMLRDGLTCALEHCHMGATAEQVAADYGVTREEQDAFALESQRRAAAAIAAGRFDDEIVPVVTSTRTGPLTITRDEHPRPEVTADRLAVLRPAFEETGTVTAGNASGINDGAAAVVLMTAEGAARLGVTPLGHIRAIATAGVAPRLMGIGPVPAVRKALARARVDSADLDLYEINEAFAAQAVAVRRDLELDPARLNVNGGAIALGHPIGASGARVAITLLYEMRRRGVHLGLASLCVGGGMGIAMVVAGSGVAN